MKTLWLSTLLGAFLVHCDQPKPEALRQEQDQERTALAQREAEQPAQAQRSAQENLDRETRSAQNTLQQAAVDILRRDCLAKCTRGSCLGR